MNMQLGQGISDKNEGKDRHDFRTGNTSLDHSGLLLRDSEETFYLRSSQKRNAQIKSKISSVTEWPIIIHHSSFIIHHSSFIIHHSSFIIHHSSFTRIPAPDELPEITGILKQRVGR
jgi:hypothetical protein